MQKLLKLEPVKFLNGGIVMKIVAFGLNYFLADYLAYDPSLVYVLVLVVDFFIGYFINRFYVFKSDTDKSHKQIFTQFMIAGLGFRALNWLIYVGIIKNIDVYILVAQAIATMIVVAMKFFVYKKIFK